MSNFLKGFGTGLVLQLAVGPVFFYVASLSIRGSWTDGLAAAVAVATVDCLYIALAIAGIGKLFESKKAKTALGAFGALVLVAFGALILKDVVGGGASTAAAVSANGILSSFASVFVLTLLNPMTILFFTGLFSAKAAEHDFSGRELRLFGLGTGAATLAFMGTTAILFSLVGDSVPSVAIRLLNAAVGCLLAGYGGMRLWASTRRPRLW